MVDINANKILDPIELRQARAAAHKIPVYWVKIYNLPGRNACFAVPVKKTYLLDEKGKRA